MNRSTALPAVAVLAALALAAPAARAQLTDVTQTPNTINAGIQKSYTQEIGAGQGDIVTPDSSLFIIARDPARAIRRGRQIFQRKFTHGQGLGPRTLDGQGPIMSDASVAAGLSDSCASCHGRPRGAAGTGGDVATRADSRDAPHLFGLGLQEMLADEITADLRAIRAAALSAAILNGTNQTKPLTSKGISYGSITARPDGTFDTTQVAGVNPDLRVRPFFAQGGTISIREFLVGAFNAEMGMESADPCLLVASGGGFCTTPSGMVLDGSKDTVEAPPATSTGVDSDGDGVVDEIPVSIVDHMEFYLLNYFKPGTYRQTPASKTGNLLFKSIKCNTCHIQDLTIQKDRRVADVDTVHDPARGIFNHLFATATLKISETDDGLGFPTLKTPLKNSFVVKNFLADMKRHDLGPNFWERNYDGSIQKMFMTEPLWGVATTAPYGHDGRSVNLTEVILRHGGEAQASRDLFAALPLVSRTAVLEFLNTLVLFPPDDTASNLDPGDPNALNFPQSGHGSIKLAALFNDPTDLE
jgi:hypothetical protein